MTQLYRDRNDDIRDEDSLSVVSLVGTLEQQHDFLEAALERVEFEIREDGDLFTALKEAANDAMPYEYATGLNFFQPKVFLDILADMGYVIIKKEQE